LGISKYVELVGYHEDVAPFLSRADVFLIPSFSEGSSVALAEAMLLGLPSIITQVGGANEIIGDSASAIQVNPYDYQSIKSAMLSFLKMDPKERKAMGIRAKQEAEKFSVKNYCSQLMELYNSPVSKAG